MGFTKRLAEAFATGFTLLSGGKRKAPEDDSQPAPMSAARPGRLQRGPERLDFSSPAVNGQQHTKGQQQGDIQGPAATAAFGQGGRLSPASGGQLAQPSTLGGVPARRLDDYLTATTVVPAAVGAAAVPSSMQLGIVWHPAAPPFTKRFAPPAHRNGVPMPRTNIQLVNVRSYFFTGTAYMCAQCIVACYDLL